MNLAGIYLDTPAGNQETEQLACRHTKGAFSRIQLHPESPQVCKCFSEVIYESLALLGFYDDIVNIYLHILIYLIMQTFLHTPLVSRAGIS
jgi:hypothetical protein